MDYRTLFHFPKIKLTEEVLFKLESIGLSEDAEVDMYDLLYRVNKSGLDPRMLGSRIIRMYPNGVGKILFQGWIITICEHDYDQLIIVDLYRNYLRCV